MSSDPKDLKREDELKDVSEVKGQSMLDKVKGGISGVASSINAGVHSVTDSISQGVHTVTDKLSSHKTEEGTEAKTEAKTEEKSGEKTEIKGLLSGITSTINAGVQSVTGTISQGVDSVKDKLSSNKTEEKSGDKTTEKSDDKADVNIDAAPTQTITKAQLKEFHEVKGEEAFAKTTVEDFKHENRVNELGGQETVASTNPFEALASTEPEVDAEGKVKGVTDKLKGMFVSEDKSVEKA